MDGHRWAAERRWVKVSAALLVVVLVWGTVRHVVDLVVGGVHAYDGAPGWLAGYWVALTGLDPLAAVLVGLRVRSGLLLAAAILITDAAANGYATYVLGMGGSAERVGHAAVTVLALATVAVLPRMWPHVPVARCPA